MKQNVPLIVSSLLSILLTLVHMAHDIAIGIDESRPSIVLFVVVLVLWSYGTVVLAERRSGYVIVFVLSLLAFGIPVLHMTGKSGISAGIKDSGEALFFGATVLALGVTALLSVVLSTHGLWTLRRGQRSASERTRAAPPQVAGSSDGSRYGFPLQPGRPEDLSAELNA